MEDSITFSPDIEDLIEEFKAHRTDMKAPITPRGVKVLRKKILRCKKSFMYDVEIIEMIEDAILSGWKSFHPEQRFRTPLTLEDKQVRFMRNPDEFYAFLTEEEKKKYL